MIVPERGTETFISTIGHLDGRIDLYKSKCVAEEVRGSVFTETGKQEGMGNRALMDLCIMASKLAYENAKVVRNIVTLHWKVGRLVFVSAFRSQSCDYTFSDLYSLFFAS